MKRMLHAVAIAKSLHSVYIIFAAGDLCLQPLSYSYMISLLLFLHSTCLAPSSSGSLSLQYAQFLFWWTSSTAFSLLKNWTIASFIREQRTTIREQRTIKCTGTMTSDEIPHMRSTVHSAKFLGHFFLAEVLSLPSLSWSWVHSSITRAWGRFVCRCSRMLVFAGAVGFSSLFVGST